MANYIPFARTSYFKVKDMDEFIKWTEKLDIEEVWTKEDDMHGELVAMSFGENGVPSFVFNGDDYDYIDFAKEISKHLVENWAVEIREIGYEKMRYLIGHTTIVRWDGEYIVVDLDSISSKVLEKWPDVNFTNCEY